MYFEVMDTMTNFFYVLYAILLSCHEYSLYDVCEASLIHKCVIEYCEVMSLD